MLKLSQQLLAIALIATILASFMLPSFIRAEVGDADVTRDRNIQPSQSEPGDADATRFKNLEAPLEGPNNADVVGKRNLQTPLSGPNDADVIRLGNLNGFEVTSEWDDDDSDGIPNYLDLQSLDVISCHGTPGLFGADWGVTLRLVRPKTTVEAMIDVLQGWGLNQLNQYTDIASLIIEIRNPYDTGEPLLSWLKQYLTITFQEELDTIRRINSVSCSDGRYRFLILLGSSDTVNWETKSCWLVDHSPIAVAAAVAIVVAAAPIWLHMINVALQAIKGNYNWVDDISKIIVGKIFMDYVFNFASVLSWGVDVFMESFQLGASINDPFFDIAVFDLMGQQVLGYDNGQIIPNSAYGVYLGRTDQMQLMMVSKTALPFNMTVASGSQQRINYIGFLSDYSNQTIMFGGTMQPNETINTIPYTIQNQTCLNHLILEYNITDASPFKGDYVPIEIWVKNENMSSVDDAAVEVSVRGQTVEVSNQGNGNYHAMLNTSMLEYGDSTVVITAGHTNYFGSIAAQTISVTFNLVMTNVSISKEVIGYGRTASATVRCENYGHYVGSLNVTLYANSTPVQTQNLLLMGQNSTTIVFNWDTTGFAYGNYTISVCATPIVGESDISDNTYMGGTVLVTIPGDVTGDRNVDASDLYALSKAYGSTPLTPNWNPNCDIDGDNKVDAADLFDLGKNYWKTIQTMETNEVRKLTLTTLPLLTVLSILGVFVGKRKWQRKLWG